MMKMKKLKGTMVQLVKKGELLGILKSESQLQTSMKSFILHLDLKFFFKVFFFGGLGGIFSL